MKLLSERQSTNWRIKCGKSDRDLFFISRPKNWWAVIKIIIVSWKQIQTRKNYDSLPSKMKVDQ